MNDQVEKLKRLNGELCAEVNALTRAHVDDVERIDALEQLVRDMWEYLSDPATEFPCCEPVCDMIRERIRELGMEVNR